jgi:predicted nucleic acid-binding protein
LAAPPRHEFWADSLPYRDVPLAAIFGHRQVTDAYLVALARSRKARLASFDGGLAQSYRDIVEPVSTDLGSSQ